MDDLPISIVIEDPQYVDPLPVVLTVHESVARLQAWHRETWPDDPLSHRDNWEAVTIPRFGAKRDDELGECVEIYLALDRLWTSIVVHEVTHAALMLYTRHHLRKHRRARAWKHIGNHTEQLPETVGNLAAHVLIVLREKFPEYLDVENEDGTATGVPMT
jgi:hypothetical protein